MCTSTPNLAKRCESTSLPELRASQPRKTWTCQAKSESGKRQLSKNFMIFHDSTPTQCWTWPRQSWLQESISEWHDIRTWNPVKHHIAPHDWQLRVGTIHQIAPNLLKAPQNNPPAIMELQLGQQSRWALASAGRLRHPWSLPTYPGLLSHCAHGYTWMQVASNGCTKQNRWKCVLLTMPNTAASCQCPNRACG